MIKVLFFAQLREQLNCSQFTIDFPLPVSVKQIQEQLIEQCPQWKIFLENDKLLVAINQTMAKSTSLVNPGDEVAFFPPVTGG